MPPVKRRAPFALASAACGGVRSLAALLEVMSAGADRCGATRTAEMLDEYRARVAAMPAAS